VRKIHTVCRVSEEVHRSELLKVLAPTIVDKIFGTDEIIRIYKGKGCNLCHNSTYEGRMGIFEMLIMDEELKQIIINKQDASTIRKVALKNGMRTMLEDGLEKVKLGETTISEILRVSQE
jgi:type II secretory ATPase GspE/PulE/Tfp pilus assembly ATPase PilB-like protein